MDSADRFAFHRLDAFCVGRREGDIAAFAVIVRNFGAEVYRRSAVLGDVSRHFATYTAAVEALRYLRAANTASAHVCFGSKLVAMQLLRRWKLNLKANYMDLYRQAGDELVYLRRFSTLDYYTDRGTEALCLETLAAHRGTHVKQS